MKDKTLQKARQAWFSEELKNLKLEFPVAEISQKTGYSDSIVSIYLKSKRTISVEFMKEFCKAYGYDFDAINHSLIEKIQKGLYNPTKLIDISIKHEPGQQAGGSDNAFSSLTKNDQFMFNKMLDMIQSRMDKDDERWDRLLSAHEKLIDKVPGVIVEEEHKRVRSAGSK